MAWHDALLCFLLWRKLLQTVFAMLYADLRMFTAFSYVCVRLARVVRILHTYTDLLLRKLCGFCVRIGLIFTMFNSDSLEGSNLEGSSISFVCAKARDSWTVSRDPILRVPSISFVR